MKRWVIIGAAVFVLALLGSVAGQALWSWHIARTELAAAEAASAAASAAEAARKLDPMEWQRDAVRKVLNDPDSAVFRNERKAVRGAGAWCGEVNARNRMGGMVGYTRYVAQLEEDRELSVLDKVHIEPTSTVSDRYKAELEAFAGIWRLYCQ